MDDPRIKKRSNEGGAVELWSRSDWLRWRRRSQMAIVEQEEGHIEWRSRSSWMSLLDTRVQVHEAKRDDRQRTKLVALHLKFLLESDPDIEIPRVRYGRKGCDRVPTDPDVNMDFVQKMTRLAGRLSEE